MRYVTLFSFLFLYSIVLYSQNLVPNGGFEEIDFSVINQQIRIYDNFSCVNEWMVGGGTPDAYNALVTGLTAPYVGVPGNMQGNQEPYEGNGYAGFANGDFIREYIQCELTEPLVAGVSYQFEMYVSLAEYPSFHSPTELVEAMFTNNRIGGHSSTLIKLLGIPGIKSDRIITDRVNWTRVGGTYVAMGGERFLTIGNFETPPPSPDSAHHYTNYYYIDGVRMHKCPPLDHSLLGNDTNMCTADSFFLNYNIFAPDITSYKWSTGSILPYLNVYTSGMYWIEINKEGCLYYDTIMISNTLFNAVDLGKDTLLCEGEELRLDAFSPGTTYLWQDGTTQSFYDVTKSGVYKVQMVNGGCSAYDSIHVNFIPRPVPDLGPDTSFCMFQPLMFDVSSSGAWSYLWNDGSTSPTLTANAFGWYWVEARRAVCTVRDSVYIAQKPLPAVDLGQDRKLCREDVQNLDAGYGTSYLWENGANVQMRSVKAPGTFYVKVTGANGCEATDTLRLDTFPMPALSLGPDSFVCQDGEFDLDAGGSYSSYIWQDGSSGSSYRVTQPGMYHVSVKDINGCSNADTIIITQRSKPHIGLASLVTICEPDFLLKPSGGYMSYQWQDGSTLPHFHVKDYGTYSVTVTDSNLCSARGTVEIRNKCRGNVFVPNAFTPNGDGHNDIFIPVTRNVVSIELSVYNRWGVLMFETEELHKGWDGSHDGETVQQDVYVYQVRYKDFSGSSGMLKGNVTLLR